VQEISDATSRIAEAGSLATTLAAARCAFELMRDVLVQAEARQDDMFAAFAFAAAAAAEARNIVLTAPSLPPGRAAPVVPVPAEADSPDLAALLAGLAAELVSALSHAAQHARGSRDQEACQDAAAEAERIRELLALGE
jgi:hypothetical protein